MQVMRYLSGDDPLDPFLVECFRTNTQVTPAGIVRVAGPWDSDFRINWPTLVSQSLVLQDEGKKSRASVPKPRMQVSPQV